MNIAYLFQLVTPTTMSYSYPIRAMPLQFGELKLLKFPIDYGLRVAPVADVTTTKNACPTVRESVEASVFQTPAELSYVYTLAVSYIPDILDRYLPTVSLPTVG